MNTEVQYWIYEMCRNFGFEVVNMTDFINHIMKNYIYTSKECFDIIIPFIRNSWDRELDVSSLIDKYDLCVDWVELVNGDWLYLDEMEDDIGLFKNKGWIE